MTMLRSWLVQRILQPREYRDAVDSLNMGAFTDGGLSRGGFTDEDNRKMKTIFRFDYMGAAEFEFGAVRDAMYLMLEDGKDLVGKTIPMQYVYKPHFWEGRYEGGPVIDEGATLTGQRNVFIIARKKHMKEVIEKLKLWACEGPQMKEPPCFDKEMTGRWKDELMAPVGWFEIDNGFMWFIDDNMYKGMCWLMEVPICD